MENKDTKPADKRIFNSAVYRKKIKRLVERAKTLRGIPLGRKIPKGPATRPKATAPEHERMEYSRVNSLSLTIDTLHFFADTVTFIPRTREPQSPVEAALAEVEAKALKK